MSIESRKQRRLRRMSERYAKALLRTRLKYVEQHVRRLTIHPRPTEQQMDLYVREALSAVLVPQPEDMLRRFKARGRWS